MISTENETISTGASLQPPSRKRMEWVDYAKGMAIILVVYRHSIVGLNRSGLEVPRFLDNLQEFVFNFRMPVFFVLSGIFLGNALAKKSKVDLVRKKIYTLLYPYLLWTFIFITIQIFLSGYTNSERTLKDYFYIITQPRELDHMWYLLALFNTSILAIILFSLFSKHPIFHLLFGVCLHLLSFFIADYSFFSDLCYHYIFLVIGLMVSKRLLNQEEINIRNIWILFITTLPVFIIGQITWLNLRPGDLEEQLLFLLIIIIACFFFYLLCRALYQAKIFLWLIPVGKHSLYIYILHFLVISSFRMLCIYVLGITNVYFIILVSLILGITLPIIIFQAGKKWGIKYLFTLERRRMSSYG